MAYRSINRGVFTAIAAVGLFNEWNPSPRIDPPDRGAYHLQGSKLKAVSSKLFSSGAGSFFGHDKGLLYDCYLNIMFFEVARKLTGVEAFPSKQVSVNGLMKPIKYNASPVLTGVNYC